MSAEILARELLDTRTMILLGLRDGDVLGADGDPGVMRLRRVAVVGSALPDAGAAPVRSAVARIAEAGFALVTSPAVGVCSEALAWAAATGAPAIAVLSSGISRPRAPRVARDTAAVASCGGLVVSPFTRDVMPSPDTRRVQALAIAGACDAMLVVGPATGEGSRRSAVAALACGRPLWLAGSADVLALELRSESVERVSSTGRLAELLSGLGGGCPPARPS